MTNGIRSHTFQSSGTQLNSSRASFAIQQQLVAFGDALEAKPDHGVHDLINRRQVREHIGEPLGLPRRAAEWARCGGVAFVCVTSLDLARVLFDTQEGPVHRSQAQSGRSSGDCLAARRW